MFPIGRGSVSLKPISFFTPIKYQHQPITFLQKITEIVDAYFHLRGRVAVVIPGQKTNGSEGTKLEAGQTTWWDSILKITSYMAYFLNFFITTRFPAITSNQRIVQLQTIVACFPLFMLIAKIVLRSVSHFHLSLQTKNEEGNSAPDTTTKTIFDTDLIPPSLKTTLDTLFGGSGSVDKLPIFVGKDYVLPTVDTMTAPIMKHAATVKGTSQKKPLIAIKMRCLSSKDELIQKSKLSQRDIEYFDFSKPIERVLILFQYRDDFPLLWHQSEDHSNHVCPVFFTWNFTFAEDGKIANFQSKKFPRLQQVIKEGGGEDFNGIRWEIIGYSKKSNA
jgi:hypothetical protein